ncbi:hypothetical protein ACFL3S_07275 [Gemmatimonadota bacterium]
MENTTMTMHELAATPPWDWPSDVDAEILAALRNREALPAERLLAAELAGDLIVMNDSLAKELLRILGSQDEPEDLRGQAAIAFGAALEEAHLDGIDDRESPSVSEPLLEQAKDALRSSYEDPGISKDVRRRALEASVRAPEPWHPGAVLAAYRDGDLAWRLTAVFCMRFVEGFDEEIVEALESGEADILYQAVLAAGDRIVPDAWPFVRNLVLTAASGEVLLPDDPDADRDLLVAAIHAVARIRPLEASETLSGIIDSDDEDLSEVALEALDMVHGAWDDEDEEDEEEPTWH